MCGDRAVRHSGHDLPEWGVPEIAGSKQSGDGCREIPAGFDLATPVEADSGEKFCPGQGADIHENSGHLFFVPFACFRILEKN